MKKTAHLEPLAGVVRVFEAGNGYGDPYCWSASARYIDSKTVELLGVTAPPQPSDWRAMRDMFRDKGVTKVIITRRRADGAEERREIRISK